MFLILRKLIDSIRGQRGQVMVMGVGVIVMSLGVMMISVDVAWWLRDKRDAQNDADAIALAAVQDLPDRLAAELSGDDWAVANGIDPFNDMGQPACTDGQLAGALNSDGFYRYCFIDQNSDGTDDMVRVKVSRPSISFIADAFGVGSPTLNPPAAAATVYVAGACVMPWGIVGEDPDAADFFGLDPEALYVFQLSNFAGEEGSSGNFGALRIYGQGTYRDVIEGSCEPAQQNACADNPLVFVDETLVDCDTEPGQMPGPTVNGLDTRFPGALGTPGPCDAATYEEALDRVDPASGTYCPERLVPVAVINAFPPQGHGDIIVYGIANFYLAGWEGGNGACFTFPDGSEKCGFVWGYFISIALVNTAEVVVTRCFIPFAPTGSALVE